MGPTRFACRAPPSVERMVYWPPAQPHVACMSDGGLRFQSRASILYLSIYSRFTATWVWARSARLRECLRAGVHVWEGHVSHEASTCRDGTSLFGLNLST